MRGVPWRLRMLQVWKGKAMSMLASYMRDVDRVKVILTREEESRLCLRAKRGDVAARETLIHAQLPRALICARKWQRPGVELCDLVQIASLGVLNAVRKFSPERGRLSTLVQISIRNLMPRELDNIAYPVHIPCTAMRRDTTRPFAVAARSNSADLPADLLSRGDDASRDQRTQELMQLVKPLIRRLPASEQEVIRLRLRGQTLNEIGRSRGVVRERIRQIESRAVERLAGWLCEARAKARAK